MPWRRTRCVRRARSGRPRGVERDVVEVAVDLVGRGEDQRRRRPRGAQRLEQVQRAERVDSKSSTRIARLVVTATCAAKWNTALRVRAPRGARAPRSRMSRDLDAHAVAVPLRAASAGSARRPARDEVVEDAAPRCPSREQAVGEVRADEAGAAGDQHGPASRAGVVIERRLIPSAPALRARRALRRRGRPRCCPSSQLGELDEPVLERRRCGSIAEHARGAAAMSAKQWRMSPTRYLPVISGVEIGACRARRPCGRRPRGSCSGRAAADVEAPRRPRLAPRARGGRRAPRRATLTKSRRCAPSSKISGGLPLSSRDGEDREHAGIGIGQRLPRAEDVEEAQRDRRDAVGLRR